jgi:superfamily II DNA or RNA helicase
MRPCGPRPNKVNNAYSKDELVKIMVDIYPKEEAEKMPIERLCRELNINYTNPREVQITKYGECIKSMSKKSLLEDHKEFLEGYPFEKALLLKKERLCDIIYERDDMFVLPEDFDEKNCTLYNMPTLTRIAVRRHIDTTRHKTQKDLCRAIQKSYLREKMTFNTDKNPVWNNSETDATCMIAATKDKELREHQKALVKHMLRHRSLLAIHATGTGKTLSAVAAMNCIMAKYPNIRVIIITPLSLVENMKKEIKRFGIDLNNEDIYTRIEIYSYDEYVNLQKRKNEIDCGNTFLIIDEAHNLRTETLMQETALEKGSKSYIIMKCAAAAFKVLLLTATPLINSIFDLRNLFMMLNGEEPDKALSREQFVKSATESLGNMINCKVSYYYPPLIPVDENYPKREDKVIDMYMDTEYYKKYQDVENSLLDKSKKDPKINDFFYHNLRVAINSLDGELSPKVNWIIDFITKEADEGRKSVVYSNWKKAGMNLLRKRLDALNRPGLYLYISGDVSSDVRKIARKKFNNDQAKVLLISKAGGEGLDLKGVRNIIIMESNWNASSDKQIIGRGIRYKSHLHLPEDQRSVTVHRLLLHKPLGSNEFFASVDDMLYEAAYKKKQPLLDSYMEIIQKNSIEKQSCSCDLGKNGNHNGCQSMEVPSILKKPIPLQALMLKLQEAKDQSQEEITEIQKQIDELNSKKKEVYEAPSGITSIAITVNDVSKRLFRKLAGIGLKHIINYEEVEDIPDIDFGEGVDEVSNLEEEVEVQSFNENLDGQIRDEVFKFLNKSNLETTTRKDVKKHIKKIFGKQLDSSLIKKFIKEYQRAQPQEEQNAEPLDEEEIPELVIEGLDDF